MLSAGGREKLGFRETCQVVRSRSTKLIWVGGDSGGLQRVAAIGVWVPVWK